MPRDSTLLSLFDTSAGSLDVLSLTDPNEWLRTCEEQIIEARRLLDVPFEELGERDETSILIYPVSCGPTQCPVSDSN
jgi:hypothetical protein